jgi:hypothetical protein
VGLRPNEAPVIVELKQAMSLALLYQAVERLAIAEHVYIAISRPKRGIASSAVKLCRRLGLGLIIVTASGSVEVMADPVPYMPRQNTAKRGLLLKEFNARSGDPNLGGSTRTPLMTAYRQDAIKCADYLSVHGPTRVSVLKAATHVDRAATILRGNVYGWFQKTDRGIYELSPRGKARG